MWFSCFASYGTGKSHCYCWPGLPPTSGFILNAKFLKVFINKNYFSPISLSLGLLWFTTLITMFMSHIYFKIVCLKLIPNKNVKFVRKRSQSVWFSTDHRESITQQTPPAATLDCVVHHRVTSFDHSDWVYFSEEGTAWKKWPLSPLPPLSSYDTIDKVNGESQNGGHTSGLAHVPHLNLSQTALTGNTSLSRKSNINHNPPTQL